jgi:hypothetical protein
MRQIVALFMLTAGGCTAIPPAVVLEPVGPAATVAQPAQGYLIVATEVEPPSMSADTMFCPHTAYAIYDRHGVFLRTVRNHLGPWDESPERVSLRPGNYTISAQASSRGDVLVPVIIRQGETTQVDLERSQRRMAGT